MISAIQIGKALEQARFPIKSLEELHAAIHYHLEVGEHIDESEISRLEILFSPRDFLFTNARQVQEVVEARQYALIDGASDIHEAASPL